jgi:hypothetical protein
MTGRIWLPLTVLAILGNASGCITAGYDGAKLAREAGPKCHVPLENRNEVYLFVMGGNNPRELMALDKFRQGVNAGGFAKVSTGSAVYLAWMSDEMKRIHREDPNAVFIIAGLDSSAAQGVKLCEKAIDAGIPIEGMVIVDASDKTPRPQRRVKTLIVGTSPVNLADPSVNSLVVTPGQLGLPAEQRTISEVVELLNEIAIQLPQLPSNEPVSEWTYPLARDVQISLEPRMGSEWDFLFDEPGGVTRAIDEPLPPRSTPPFPGSTTAVK